MADKNKVKFGLNNVHWAKITGYDEGTGKPTYAAPVRLPGAVSISMSPEGEPENFYADDGVYYVIGNNSGYSGDLEVALITSDFATTILGEIEDAKGVQYESSSSEPAQFALLFEFTGDKNKIRHAFYCCTASRSSTEGATREDATEVQTETLTITASPLASYDGIVKAKTNENTDATTYDAWYTAVYVPDTTSAAG